MYMKKKIYIKPQIEELDGAVSMILAVSGNAIDNSGYEEFGGARHENGSFTEDDDSEE